MNQVQVELQESMGNDISIANAAWTSTYDKTKREDKYDDPEKVANIVRRLILDGHGVPIESVIFRFWIRMPIFTDRQHMTHRVASHNGLSGRYRTMPNDWYQVPEDCIKICKKLNLEFLGARNAEEVSRGDLILTKYKVNCVEAYEEYNQSIDWLREAEKSGKITNQEFKRVREIIRGMLPTAGMVERTSIMNLRSFANYYRLRSDVHAQPEIQYVAKEMLRLIEEKNICPIAISALKEIGWRC